MTRRAITVLLVASVLLAGAVGAAGATTQAVDASGDAAVASLTVEAPVFGAADVGGEAVTPGPIPCKHGHCGP